MALRTLCLASLLFLLPALRAGEAGTIHVLALFSYHPAEWSDAVLAGWRATVAGRHDIELVVEYMDTKRIETREHLDALAGLYARKYRDFHVELLLACDDHAVNFLLERREALFGGAPLVFCGLNRWEPLVARPPPGCTGVVERVDWDGTLATARRCRPAARAVHAIVDDTETARTNLAELRRCLATQHPTLRLDEVRADTVDALGRALAGLPRDDLAMFIAFWRDGAGRAVHPDELTAPFQASACPVFGRSEWMIGRGQAAGRCVCGDRQGRASGTLALRVLAGEDAGAIPIVTDSPNPFLADWRELERHRIDPDLLPAGAEIRFQPEPFWRVPKAVAALALALLALLTGLVLALMAHARWRRRSARILAEREEDLRTTLDSIGDAVISTLPDGRVSRLNPVAERLTGWTAAEAVGRPLVEVFPISDAATGRSADDPVARVLTTGQVVGLASHTLLRHRDGRQTPIADSAAPVRGPDGTVRGVVLVFRDISSEQALREQFLQAQKAEVIGRLAGGVAHDFNNLLGAIIGHAEFLAELPAGEARRHAEAVLAAADRGAALTRHLLAYARRGRTTTVAIDVHRLLDETVAILGRTLGPDITIDLRLQAPDRTVIGDPVLLESAVLNLCLNARDAMPQGGILSLITDDETVDEATQPPGVRQRLRPGRYLALSVRDTGTGIPLEAQIHLFEPFFTTKEPGRGTGLGLAAVWGASADHGGSVAVHSTPGRGSTFVLYLPLADAPAATAGPAAPGTLRFAAGATVLIADDDPVLRRIVEEILSQAGFRVLVAVDGAAADRLHAEHAADIRLCILDLTMPVMGGREAARRIRDRDGAARILFMSGYLGEDAGIADAFLPKPVRRADLLAAVARLIGSPRSSGNVTAGN